jgi:hypothetical protein
VGSFKDILLPRNTVAERINVLINDTNNRQSTKFQYFFHRRRWTGGAAQLAVFTCACDGKLESITYVVLELVSLHHTKIGKGSFNCMENFWTSVNVSDQNWRV